MKMLLERPEDAQPGSPRDSLRDNASAHLLADDAMALACSEFNVWYGSAGELRTVMEDTVGECQARCAALPGCAAFSYVVRSGGCHLFGAGASRQAMPRDGVVSGMPACGRSSPQALRTAAALMQSGICFEKDTSYNVLDMGGVTPTRADSVLDCQQRCMQAPGCAHFTYSTLDHICHLESPLAEPVANPDSGLIAGPARCRASKDKLVELLLARAAAEAEDVAAADAQPSAVSASTPGTPPPSKPENRNAWIDDSVVGGACHGEADAERWHAKGQKGFHPEFHGCAMSCLGGGLCVSQCFLRLGYTKQCASCFGDTSSCSVSNCFFQCMGGESPGCSACTVERCKPVFLKCSGLTY